jgi:hypothetical protein
MGNSYYRPVHPKYVSQSDKEGVFHIPATPELANGEKVRVPDEYREELNMNAKYYREKTAECRGTAGPTIPITHDWVIGPCGSMSPNGTTGITYLTVSFTDTRGPVTASYVLKPHGHCRCSLEAYFEYSNKVSLAHTRFLEEYTRVKSLEISDEDKTVLWNTAWLEFQATKLNLERSLE